ncbi:Enoyl-[acyl-carrier-protein] reductase [FMN] [Acidisarcina polymorpha]|uniref:Nitronate monooxygenase n=1 Tax=Acidisarcina polymorpha TaxID=2211140 RepID=A0A2Z5FT04_9BACT|nr:nitronate monooxygenase [Acidisarcina polymorpha]AXC09943.1 Enoyl-[acyl-carrier-protein] reductase [FMN] [Acidisarcina polymorpha]
MIERTLDRACKFAASLDAAIPILMAPMAGASPVSLAAAVSNAGGMGACGALLLSPASIASWAEEFRSESDGPFQMNLWVSDPAPIRDAASEHRQRTFLSTWGPAVPAESADAQLEDPQAQLQALLQARPRVISSIMGLFPPAFISEMKAHGILWFATATTVSEARAAAAAGADAIVAQGAEAGGHRGTFHAAEAEAESVGLFALLPQICDAVSLPVIATGGIADGRAIAAALVLGASAVQIGTGFLRCPEAKIHQAYSDRLARTEAHHTRLTRAFSGRTGRAIRNRYVEAAAADDAPVPAPYPVQRALTRGMRDEAFFTNDPERMQMWAGQAARYAKAEPATTFVRTLWNDAMDRFR